MVVVEFTVVLGLTVVVELIVVVTFTLVVVFTVVVVVAIVLVVATVLVDKLLELVSSPPPLQANTKIIPTSNNKNGPLWPRDFTPSQTAATPAALSVDLTLSVVRYIGSPLSRVCCTNT
jgi:hypothetical protein